MDFQGSINSHDHFAQQPASGQHAPLGQQSAFAVLLSFWQHEAAAGPSVFAVVAFTAAPHWQHGSHGQLAPQEQHSPAAQTQSPGQQEPAFLSPENAQTAPAATSTSAKLATISFKRMGIISIYMFGSKTIASKRGSWQSERIRSAWSRAH